MSQIEIPNLQACKDRFATFGECNHYHREWIKPYGMETQIKTCMVCAKTFEKKYPTQAEQIKAEIIKTLDAGMTDKNEIYTKVVDSLEVPRPTVRRVSRDLIREMETKVQILKSDMPHTNILRRTEQEYDCPSCLSKKIISKGMNRCPKCQQYLDWSDEE